MKDKINQTWIFIKKLSGVIVAAGIGFAGIYTIYKGLQASQPVLHYAFIVAGACAVVDAFYVIWAVLMKQPKKDASFKAVGRK